MKAALAASRSVRAGPARRASLHAATFVASALLSTMKRSRVGTTTPSVTCLSTSRLASASASGFTATGQPHREAAAATTMTLIIIINLSEVYLP